MIKPTIDDIYKSCKIAESKTGFEEYGYEEYFNGLYTINDLAAAIVEEWEKNTHHKKRGTNDS